ncbi:hypothetical protein FVEG_07375 [Fusarium verticillioides 7600]|uniref:Uncharacterized protein n=1 Tax=Gibberella moniliformis (strain M3125 / FGSC 7600) TaxID=334819 RepID=W7MHZ9_GIBM7|nr:hypothetical protein FVEG_07375 [Fusarium verticillioides 7600]XP_018753377.1 hypothetical protein FVEG_07375 [Fusarium verticillioides 7600]XP_018753378.1 hypothetical protein FVEG_07375 [Fusarium verticillioides 7600]XP_018753379.1 hypothetical protein FVEG_07375 [Fusarium verticillioides 7600]XP_018753380.1 hypothetical protein FVEG_07375 [Fusarium verticillioides 7600]XP_018753381.1 hypothetical protein FVEG_07375 [Fusarium verticillioides 7600]XP_018753382.1 hypothetical protein FVEG_
MRTLNLIFSPILRPCIGRPLHCCLSGIRKISQILTRDLAAWLRLSESCRSRHVFQGLNRTVRDHSRRWIGANSAVNGFSAVSICLRSRHSLFPQPIPSLPCSGYSRSVRATSHLLTPA